MFPRHEQREMYEAGRAGGKCYDTMGVCKTEQNRGPSYVSAICVEKACAMDSVYHATFSVSFLGHCLSLAEGTEYS